MLGGGDRFLFSRDDVLVRERQSRDKSTQLQRILSVIKEIHRGTNGASERCLLRWGWPGSLDGWVGDKDCHSEHSLLDTPASSYTLSLGSWPMNRSEIKQAVVGMIPGMPNEFTLETNREGLLFQVKIKSACVRARNSKWGKNGLFIFH